jgi:hypothetical protein
MNETLEKKIKDIRNFANDIVPEQNEDWCYSTGELCDRASHQARIELAKEAILIIDELLKENKEFKQGIELFSKLINKYL